MPLYTPPYHLYPPRPDGTPAETLTLTQCIHDWVHYLEARGWDIADGSRGKPSFPADMDALTAMRSSLDAITHVAPYGTSPLGEADYRAQAAEGLCRLYPDVPFEADDIIFTPGGQFGLAAAFYLVESLRPHSSIIAPHPWYLNHEELASLFADGRLISGPRRDKFIPVEMLDTPGHTLSAAALEAAITHAEKTAHEIGAFLFCNPVNPLGTVIRADEWRAILPILARYPDVPIILDEAFAEVIYTDPDHYSLLHAAPELALRTVLFRSGTKALGLPGERLAAMAVPPAYLPIITRLQSRLLGNPPLSLQAGMAAALAGLTPTKRATLADYYRARRDQLVAAFTGYDLLLDDTRPPEGGFFTLIDLSHLLGLPVPDAARDLLVKDRIDNDVDIAFALLHGFGQAASQGVALMPGSCFGITPTRGLMRISFSGSETEVAAICTRVLAALTHSKGI